MPITTLSSREFNQQTGKAKRAARKGPVFITDRGTAAYVLMTMEEYRKTTGKRESIADLLAMPYADDIDFEPPRMRGPYSRPVDLT